MSLEAQDSPTIRTTCGVLILLFIVISVQAIVQGAIAGKRRLSVNVSITRSTVLPLRLILSSNALSSWEFPFTQGQGELKKVEDAKLELNKLLLRATKEISHLDRTNDDLNVACRALKEETATHKV